MGMVTPYSISETIPSKKGNCNVCSDGDHRNGIHHGGGNTGYQLVAPGPEVARHGPHFSSSSGITVCSMGSALLMRSQNMTDLTAVFV